jgi:hypothetical protein
MRATPTGKLSKWGKPILSDGTLDYSFKDPVPLNRSRKWAYAAIYEEARDMSPSDRPVR